MEFLVRLIWDAVVAFTVADTLLLLERLRRYIEDFGDLRGEHDRHRDG